MMPWKVLLWPMGICTATAGAPRRSMMLLKLNSKSAPSLSILLTKQTRGTLYLVAWRQTVSDWASTPSLPSNTATAPSSTRRSARPRP